MSYLPILDKMTLLPLHLLFLFFSIFLNSHLRIFSHSHFLSNAILSRPSHGEKHRYRFLMNVIRSKIIADELTDIQKRIETEAAEFDEMTRADLLDEQARKTDEAMALDRKIPENRRQLSMFDGSGHFKLLKDSITPRSSSSNIVRFLDCC